MNTFDKKFYKNEINLLHAFCQYVWFILRVFLFRVFLNWGLPLVRLTPVGWHTKNVLLEI